MTKTGNGRASTSLTTAILRLTLAAALGSSCVAQHEQPSASDTVTNWLHTCTSNTDCTHGNLCLQRVCTLVCRSDDQGLCTSLHTGASCETQADGPPICDLPCSSDARCNGFRSDFACDDGFCRARSSSDVDTTGADAGEPTAVGPQRDAASAIAEAGSGDGGGLQRDAAESEIPSLQEPLPSPSTLDDPGCTTRLTPQKEYADQQALEALLVGKWAPCMPADQPGYGFRGEDVGVEFVSGGMWYGLSEVDGEIVRNDASGTWTFLPPDQFLIDELRTNAPFITDSPRSARIGVDPRFPRYVPLTR